LRREKIDVLKELPQKIIQDFYCSMTDLQVNYEIFIKSLVLNNRAPSIPSWKKTKLLLAMRFWKSGKRTTRKEI